MMHYTSVIPFGRSNTQTFNIFFTTDYQRWHENLFLAKLPSGEWAHAIRVVLDGSTAVLMQCVSKTFPNDKPDEGAWTRIGCTGGGWR
jgi:hypothetical protein